MLRALNNRIIISRTEEVRQTAGGIILQRDASEQVFGVVESIGPDVKQAFNVGDRIVVLWNTVGTMTHEGRTYFVVAEDNVLAIVGE
jgi:co-chaperonin GroES (HSP10)